ncbi:MAG: SDR family NAD(P)-dependent oxidoreductase [Chloroflexi bacterium]|nr:SDR family NAD(P)-dependent oxidoreductase [Chloroflexota bacterium]
MFADLNGKVALVTGGGQGLGLGIVLKMAEQGADVAIADLSEENAANAARQVEALGRKAYTAKMDVTDKESIRVAVEKITSEAGHIDILVNNAGVAGAPGSTGTAFRGFCQISVLT